MSNPSLYSYRVKKIVKIVDGDTVDCIIDLGFDMRMETRVRLAGIDTPETRTRDLEEKKFGYYAKDWITKKLSGDIIITTEYDNEKGNFGRVLGTFWVNGHNLNQWMIAENVAVEYNASNKELMEAAHLENRKILTEKGLV